jgi:tetratricopeptide (TPR) repeat protein
MKDFALPFLVTEENHQGRDLLRKIKNSPPGIERDNAIQELITMAKRSNEPTDWNLVGLGMFDCGRTDQAIKLFAELVDIYPGDDIFRFNLATCYSQHEEIEMCRYHLQQIVEKGNNPDNKTYARELLDNDRFLGRSEDDAQLRQLQMKSLRKKIIVPDRRQEDFVALAKLLLLEFRMKNNEELLQEAVTVLEHANSLYPGHTEILGHLVLVYLHNGSQQKLDDAIRQLEQAAPDSPLLAKLSNIDDKTANDFSKKIYEQAGYLFQLVINNEGDIRERALKDLRRLVTVYPQNLHNRLYFAFALAVAGNTNDSLREANNLSVNPIPSHSFHFNLGQVFYICGDKERGRQHLDIALELAETNEEKKDVKERIEDLENY